MSRREENAVMAAVAEADAMAAGADATAAEADVAGAMADLAAEADVTEIVAAEAAHEPADVTETGIADAIGIGIATEARSPRVAAAAMAAARKRTNADAARL